MLHVPVQMVTEHEKVQYLFPNDASKPEVIEKKICEGTDFLNSALQSDMTSLQVMVVSARSVGWGSNKAGTYCVILCETAYLSVS